MPDQRMQKPEAQPPRVKRPNSFIPSGEETKTMFEHDNSATKEIVKDRNPNTCTFHHIIKDVTPARKK